MIHRNADLTFYLVRHGKSARDGPDNARSSSELTRLGRAQARALGRRLARERVRFDRVYSSSLVRAVQTTELVLAELGGESSFERVDELVERREGDWEHLPRAERYSVENRAYIFGKSEYLFVPEGGESLRMVERRVLGWLEDTILYNEAFLTRPQRLLLVCHGQVIRTLLQHAIHYSPHMIRRLNVSNASITELGYDHSGWSLERFNDAAHLAELEER